MFFGAADKFMEIVSETSEDVVIIRMRAVPALDATAYQTFMNIYNICKKNEITLILSHVNEQPMQVLKKAGFVNLIGKENICKNIDEALARASEIVTNK